MIRSSPLPLSRRQVLKSAGAGFGYLALAGMLGEGAAAAERGTARPLAPRQPHFKATAKRIIFLFMEGGISQLDTCDYKPELQQGDGKSGPGGVLAASKFKFQQYGETGSWFSELLPNIATQADKLCWLRGLHTDNNAHPQAVLCLHTGRSASVPRPSVGAWLLYGLGTENQNLPGYVTINPPSILGGAANYGSAFMPATYQGTRTDDLGQFPNLKSRSTTTSLQRKQLDLLQRMNHKLAVMPGMADQVDGIIESYELAFQMQGKVPELLDISSEPQKVLDAYGVKPGPNGAFARQCLMARRLSEAGVRFVEICQPNWDHHFNLHEGLKKCCSAVDRPAAALLTDLEQRGLLDETLVLFGSEMGRTPTAQGADGRNHNITGYSMFLAGGGVKSGFTYGATDELGARAVSGGMHTNDLHATLLALMGLDHERLTYRYSGRDFRLTDVAGRVVTEIFA